MVGFQQQDPSVCVAGPIAEPLLRVELGQGDGGDGLHWFVNAGLTRPIVRADPVGPYADGVELMGRR